MTPRPISGFRMSVSCVNTGTSQIMTRDIQMQPKLAHICGRPCLLSRIRGVCYGTQTPLLPEIHSIRRDRSR